VTESNCTPAFDGSFDLPQLSDRYRAKALAAEESAKTAPNVVVKVAWTEIAIEWHARAAKTAVGLPIVEVLQGGHCT
jgi:hypothetical protein